MFTLKKKYSSHVQALVKELHSSELANEILIRYQIYKEDPLLVSLYSVFFQVRNQRFYSSLALSMIKSASMIENSENSEKTAENLNGFIKQLDFRSESLFTNSKGNTRELKSLKKLSFDVKVFLVQRKISTYKEIADNIVTFNSQENEKNIRRRVYDAINVMTAIGFLKKRGKSILFIEKNEGIFKKLQKKRELLKSTAKKYENLLAIIKRNQSTPNLRNSIHFPFLLLIPSKSVTPTKASIKTELSLTTCKVSSYRKLKLLKAFQTLSLLTSPFPPSLPAEVYSLLQTS